MQCALCTLYLCWIRIFIFYPDASHPARGLQLQQPHLSVKIEIFKFHFETNTSFMCTAQSACVMCRFKSDVLDWPQQILLSWSPNSDTFCGNWLFCFSGCRPVARASHRFTKTAPKTRANVQARRRAERTAIKIPARWKKGGFPDFH